MKCPNCGADITSGKFCEFCGTPLTTQMLDEQERLNKQGCPACRSTNIIFEREKQGEQHTQYGTRIFHSTVGLCRDCGYTWAIPEYRQQAVRMANTMPVAPVQPPVQPQPKRRTWLWVLGWICIFPVPLTILLSRKKDMNPILKYGLILLVWAAYFAIANS